MGFDLQHEIFARASQVAGAPHYARVRSWQFSPIPWQSSGSAARKYTAAKLLWCVVRCSNKAEVSFASISPDAFRVPILAFPRVRVGMLAIEFTLA